MWGVGYLSILWNSSLELRTFLQDIRPPSVRGAGRSSVFINPAWQLGWQRFHRYSQRRRPHWHADRLRRPSTTPIGQGACGASTRT